MAICYEQEINLLEAVKIFTEAEKKQEEMKIKYLTNLKRRI